VSLVENKKKEIRNTFQHTYHTTSPSQSVSPNPQQTHMCGKSIHRSKTTWPLNADSKGGGGGGGGGGGQTDTYKMPRQERGYSSIKLGSAGTTQGHLVLPGAPYAWPSSWQAKRWIVAAKRAVPFFWEGGLQWMTLHGCLFT